MENFGIGKSAATVILGMAYEQIKQDNDKISDKILAVQLERCEEILKECMESKERAQALKAIDIINKMFCLYIEKQDINVHGDVIRFEFDTAADKDEQKE